MSGEPLVVGDDDWDAVVLGSELPVLVDFWAPWCVPCRRIEPAVRALAAGHAERLRVARLDVDAHPRTAARYDVLSLPTLILFAEGRPRERIVGAIRPGRLERAVLDHVADL